MTDRDPPDVSHSLKAWSDALAADIPVPGGGAAAAITASLAASLVAMSARLTLNHEEFRDVEDTFGQMAEEADSLREDLVLLAEEDVLAYGAVAQALAIPHDGPDETILRRINLNAALVGAAEVQIAVLRLAQITLSLSRAAVDHGNPRVQADAATAGLLAAAAARAAWLNVRADLGLVREEILEEDAPGDMSDEKIAGLLKQATRLMVDVKQDERGLRRIMRWP
jgi:formiminotetrahydrofolate cyclodeaminase